MAEAGSARAGGPGVVTVGPRDNAPWLIAIAGVAVVGGLWLRLAGLPTIDLHGPLHQAGVMAPTCGGTRAAYLLVRGDILGAWSWNPLVPLLAIGFAAAVVRFVAGRVSGRWLNVRVPRRAWVVALAVGFVILEINQQIQAERLIHVVPT